MPGKGPSLLRLAAGQAIVQRIALPGRQPARDLAHDRNDRLHDITAGAAGSTSQKYPPRRGSLFWRRPGPQTPNRPDLTLPRVLSAIERREASDGVVDVIHIGPRLRYRRCIESMYFRAYLQKPCSHPRPGTRNIRGLIHAPPP